MTSGSNAPEVLNLRGFDPASRCLHRHYTAGHCLGEYIPPGSWFMYDSAVAPRSGELVALRLFAPGKPDAYSVKQLERIGDRWFIVSLDGWHELDPAHCEILGKIVQIIRRAGHGSAPTAPQFPVEYLADQARTWRRVAPFVRKGLDRRSLYPLCSGGTQSGM